MSLFGAATLSRRGGVLDGSDNAETPVRLSGLF